jgi:hypothetical protein
MNVLKLVQGMPKIELALMKPVGISKFFCLLDVVAPSHGHRGVGLAMIHAGERAARMLAFDNLGDEKVEKAVEKSPASLPSMPG